MSKTEKKILNLNRNEYVDRSIEENEKFPELTIRLETIDSVLLLLDSPEELVLIGCMKHLTEFIRRNDENVWLLKEKNVLELLLSKSFFRVHDNILVKRFSLYLSSFIMENTNCLLDVESQEIFAIMRQCLTYFLEETDDFCSEYLCVMINKCLDDPQVVVTALSEEEFIEKFFSGIANSLNPDVILHSFEILQKMLLVQQANEERNDFIARPTFPIERLLCELQSEFFEIRKASLRVINTLIAFVPFEDNPLWQEFRAKLLLEQLSKIYCQSELNEELKFVVEVLAAAMDHELMASLFFEFNFYDKYLARLNEGFVDDDHLSCLSLKVLTECVKYVKFLIRLVSSGLTEKLLQCLLNNERAPAFILQGLNRLSETSEASNRIIESYSQEILTKLLGILSDIETEIKCREQASYLLQNLLSFSFHATASFVLELNLPDILANIFTQDFEQCSIDLLLSGLNIIETLAVNTDYREKLCESKSLILNIGLLLMNSFSSAVLVVHIFRCLCSIVDNPEVRSGLLENHLCSSIKRGLESSSKQVKTAATNFIMQSTRFNDLLNEYIDSGVLETLILLQKHSYCVATWIPAIDSILAKSPTWKFCIRNNLSFNDTTFCCDFFVSKKKFDDFRIFQSILKEEVSPLHPVIVVNFNRCEAPENLVVRVPISDVAIAEKEWCYCRFPGDEFLPQYLQEVNTKLEILGLAVNPTKQPRIIDFDNLAKRAQVIAEVVSQVLGNDLKKLDLNATEECHQHAVKCHLKELSKELHCSIIPLGRIRSGCQFERAVLFKGLADQVGLPCTLQRSVDGRILFNEVPLPIELEQDEHCDRKTMEFMPWRMLRPTHIVDLMFNVGELYPLQSRQALQYLRLF